MKGPQVLAAASLLCLVSCGYHVGGKADLVPKNVTTIAIPAFQTLSTRYKLVDQLPQQIGREFLSRTRFRIVDNPSVADAVLNGTINGAGAYPTVLDPLSSKATSVQVNVNITVRLVERATGRVLYTRSNWNFRENYFSMRAVRHWTGSAGTWRATWSVQLSRTSEGDRRMGER
jgi:hypothetical protein